MGLFSIDPSLASALLMQVALGACPVQDAPKVIVHFASEPVYYSESHKAATLKTSLAKDKESTLATDKRSVVMGVTTSVTSSNFNVSFKMLTDRQGNQCLYVDTATFWIVYRPAVFISKDILDIPCSLQVTKEHEAQHVKIDMQAIHEYLPQIQTDMLLYLRSLGYQGFGPYPQSELPKHRERLMKEIVEASKPMAEKLREARRKRQGEIDTPENYRRESEKCPQDKETLQKRFISDR